MQKETNSMLWLIILVAGVPQFSEILSTPALPDIAQALHVKTSWVEYTLTVYLAGLSIGTLFWGKLSDIKGRKPCVLMGFGIYALGCIGCYLSTSIQILMISRFIQALGGSAGIVLGHAMCRDAFLGAKRGKAFSTMGLAISASMAVGPAIGGFMDQNFGWTSIFLLLALLGMGTLALSFMKIEETLPIKYRKHIPLQDTLKQMIQDPKVINFSLMIGGAHGIGFSYYAEGPFYFKLLGLTPSLYGLTFLLTLTSLSTGAYFSRMLHDHFPSFKILGIGVKIILIGAASFSCFNILFYFLNIPKILIIIFSLLHVMSIMMGIGMVLPNAMSLALEDYKENTGAASALFGFFYYAIISLLTLGMGYLHNDTLFPMPFYFFGIGIIVWILLKRKLHT